MTTKKFFLMIFSVLLIIFGLILALNIFVNPFGLFNDKIYTWDSYNFTQNPRIAKIEYIDKHRDAFNSYIIGSSGCGSIQVDTINKYSEDKYYNAFYYGSDLMDSYNTIKYLSNTGEVKNIFLGINYNTAMFFDVGDEKINQRMHGKVVGKNILDFYLSYLFVNPKYSIEKIKNSKEDSFFQKSFDVFIAETGVYDKSIRDSENIGDLDGYLGKDSYKIFNSYPREIKELKEIESFTKYMGKIKDLCSDKNINLTVAVLPIFWEDFGNYDIEELEVFYRNLSSVTGFWDFSKSTISTDPRYFYDSSHFRNPVGDMILARIYNDNSIYIPDDFGHKVNNDNIDLFMENFKSYKYNFKEELYTAQVPILLFHDIDDLGDYSVSQDQFRRQMNLLKEKGFNTISFQDLYDYTLKGKELPDNPILITFDDGYQSNYEIAYPILKDLNMKATIYIIGHSLGKDTYKETGHSIYPHFDYDASLEMYKSGLIDIQSHSYDMHQAEDFEDKPLPRESVQRFDNETEEDYIIAFNNDFIKENEIINRITSSNIHSFSYPKGYFDTETETLLSLLGVKSTVTIKPGINTLVKGLPQSLFGLKRINVYRDMADDKLLDLCGFKK